jgi:DNA-binding ferritin-like protein
MEQSSTGPYRSITRFVWPASTALNQILADTMTLRDMYKKHHWQVSGPTFYQLHLLFDKHYGEQAELVDTLAERIQTLGGVAIAMAHDVAETTRVARVPRGREDATIQLFRLLQAHELIIDESREAAHAAAASGDDGTNDCSSATSCAGTSFKSGSCPSSSRVQVWPTKTKRLSGRRSKLTPRDVASLTNGRGSVCGRLRFSEPRP